MPSKKVYLEDRGVQTEIRMILTLLLFLLSPNRVLAQTPTLRVGFADVLRSLDWQQAHAPVERWLSRQLMRGLFRVDVTGAMACDLCRSWSVSADGRHYRFEFREALQWSDLTTFRPSELASTLVDLSQSTAGSVEGFQEIEAVSSDAGSLTIDLSSADPDFLRKLAMPMSFPIRRAKITEHETGPVLGAFRLKKWISKQRMILEANAQYAPQDRLKSVELIMESTTRLKARFKKRELDLVIFPVSGSDRRDQYKVLAASHLTPVALDFEGLPVLSKIIP